MAHKHWSASALKSQNGNVIIGMLAVLVVTANLGTSLLAMRSEKTATDSDLLKRFLKSKSEELSELMKYDFKLPTALAENSASQMTCFFQNPAPTSPCTGTDEVVIADGGSNARFGLPGVGFDYNGAPCSGFDPVNGNPNCPLRFKITFTPSCYDYQRALPFVPSMCLARWGTLVAQVEHAPGASGHDSPSINLSSFTVSHSGGDYIVYAPPPGSSGCFPGSPPCPGSPFPPGVHPQP